MRRRGIMEWGLLDELSLIGRELIVERERRAPRIEWREIVGRMYGKKRGRERERPLMSRERGRGGWEIGRVVEGWGEKREKREGVEEKEEREERGKKLGREGEREGEGEGERERERKGEREGGIEREGERERDKERDHNKY
ncbi:hypothetical protein Tco_1069336 [Tanacetum coccineum]|uniref:Uncharacterized protein n=1 Tax=Tanacetum coccineum TaxID=301880 RepID=A0ABQ5HJD2_9ASTR